VAPSYPALALRRARGWIVERAFARIGATVTQPKPSLRSDRPDVVAAQLIRERDGQRLVNEYPPRRPPLSLAPAPQPPARGLPGTEKLVQRVACFEVIEEVVHGNTNADEYQLSAHDLWIAVKDLIFHDALE